MFPSGEGVIYVKRDGSIFRFCSSKCLRNFRLGRNPRKMKWVVKAKQENVK